MNFKRWTAILVLILMILSLFTGCKPTVPDEEEAVTDLIVESEEQEMSGDAPEKVEDSENSASQEDAPQKDDTVETPDVSADPDTPVTNQPSTDTPSVQPDNDVDKPSEGEQSEPGNPGTAEEETDPNLKDVDAGNFIKIIAYNVRNGNDGEGLNLADRQPRFKMLVEELNADILALSECNESWIAYLQKNIEGSKYKMIYQYRGVNSRESQPLLYDQTKFDLLDSGYFWLTETPEVESKADKANYIRGATWAKLKVKATGREFLYYSTHLEGYDETVKLSYDVISAHAAKQNGFSELPVFVSGDFNTRPWSKGYSEFVQTFNDFNDYLGFDVSCTAHGYYPERTDANYIIDYVMGDQTYVVPTHYEVLNRQYLGGCISDHRGIYAECYIK